jgi:hypothetical protein
MLSTWSAEDGQAVLPTCGADAAAAGSASSPWHQPSAAVPGPTLPPGPHQRRRWPANAQNGHDLRPAPRTPKTAATRARFGREESADREPGLTECDRPRFRKRAHSRRYGRLPIRLPWQSAPYRKIVLRFIGFSLAAHLGSPLAPEGGSRAAAISTAQPDHHLARPTPLNRRCHASGSQPSPGSCRTFSERSSNR